MSHLLSLILLIAVILLASKAAGYLSLRIGQPAVFGKILLGLLLGPTFLSIMDWHIGSLFLFGGEHHGEQLLQTLKDFAELGVLLLMFMAGLETDVRQVLKVGKAALLAAIGGVVGPMATALLATEAFLRMGLPFNNYEALFIGTVLTATSVSISAQTMMELGVLKSREGSTILGAAVIDDVVGIIILSLVIAFKPADALIHSAPEKLLDWIILGLQGAGLDGTLVAWVRIGLLLALMVGFFLLAFALDRILVQRFVRRFERLPVTEGLLSGVLIIGLLYAWAAEWIGGVAAITGTYVCGVLLARSLLRHEIEEKLHTITYALFVPLFFVSIGLEANARPIFAPLLHPSSMSAQEWLWLGFTFAIILLAIAGKVLGCSGGARLAGFSRLESYRVGVGMVSRGEVGIIISLVGLNAGIIDTQVFSIMVLMVLVTTLVTPIWLKAAFREKQPPTDAPTEPELTA